jgi:hypothetical protein
LLFQSIETPIMGFPIDMQCINETSQNIVITRSHRISTL